MGRVVAIDGKGTGDITKTGEIWRAGDLASASPRPPRPMAGSTSWTTPRTSTPSTRRPASALHAQPRHDRTRRPGRADGKLYLTEEEGKVLIVEPGHRGQDPGRGRDRGARRTARRDLGLGGHRLRPRLLHDRGRHLLSRQEGRAVQGDGHEQAHAGRRARAGRRRQGGAAPHRAGRADREGGRAGRPRGLVVRRQGTLSAEGEGHLEPRRPGRRDFGGRSAHHARQSDVGGEGEGALGELSATTQARFFAPLPWTFDFEAGAVPRHWIGAGPRFKVADRDGGKRLQKPPLETGLQRASVFIGPATLSGYTIEADVMATSQGRRVRRPRPDQPGLHAGPPGQEGEAAAPGLGQRAREVGERRLSPPSPRRGIT